MKHFHNGPVQTIVYANHNGVIRGQEDLALKALDAGMAILKSLDIVHWVDSGTLLGLWRNGHLIPHDTDLDVSALYPGPEDIQGQLQSGQHHPSKLDTLMRKAGFKLLCTQRAHGRNVQDSYIHRKTGLPFDIYWFWQDGDTLVNHNDMGIFRDPYDMICPPGDLDGRPVPKNTEAYLERRYGPDWRIPTSSKGDWRDDAANLIRHEEPA